MQMLYSMICIAENRASLVWEFLSLLRAGAHWSDNIRVWARCICIWKPSQWENSLAGHSCKFCDNIDNLHQMFSSSGGCGRPESGPGKETDINMITKMGEWNSAWRTLGRSWAKPEKSGLSTKLVGQSRTIHQNYSSTDFIYLYLLYLGWYSSRNTKLPVKKYL